MINAKIKKIAALALGITVLASGCALAAPGDPAPDGPKDGPRIEAPKPGHGGPEHDKHRPGGPGHDAPKPDRPRHDAPKPGPDHRKPDAPKPGPERPGQPAPGPEAPRP